MHLYLPVLCLVDHFILSFTIGALVDVLTKVNRNSSSLEGGNVEGGHCSFHSSVRQWIGKHRQGFPWLLAFFTFLHTFSK